jgi:hypothetical protein
MEKFVSINNRGSDYSKVKLFNPLLENIAKQPRFIES